MPRHWRGRREAIRGSNACVPRVAIDGRTGLARSTDRKAQCCGKNFLRFCSPCSAQKAGGLPSVANPARRMRRALSFTPRPTSRHPRPPYCSSSAKVNSPLLLGDPPSSVVIHQQQSPFAKPSRRLRRRAAKRRLPCKYQSRSAINVLANCRTHRGVVLLYIDW